MENWHLTPELLERLLARDRDDDENRALLHLLAVCPECRTVGGYLLDLCRTGALGPQWGSIDAALARSRAEAPALFLKLAPFPFEKKNGLIRDARQFRSWGLAELLAKKSEEEAPEDATRAVELAELAVLVASLLEEWEPAELTWLYQLRAKCFAQLGNARRVLGELRSANHAFAASDRFWELGAGSAGDSLGYEARILTQKASLRREERRLPEARALLGQALLADPDEELRGAILINQATIADELGKPEEALALLEDAERALPEEVAPRLTFAIRHNRVIFLVNAGRSAEAAALLPEVRQLGEATGGSLHSLRMRWAEAKIAAESGAEGCPLRLFEELRHEFSTRRMRYDTALVSIELALLHYRAGRLDEVTRIAETIVPIFAAEEVHREALAATSLLLRAAREGTLNALLFHRIAAFLKRARYLPDLRFEDDLSAGEREA